MSSFSYNTTRPPFCHSHLHPNRPLVPLTPPLSPKGGPTRDDDSDADYPCETSSTGLTLLLTPGTPNMAAVAGLSSRHSPFAVPDGASDFQAHVLSLLSVISQHPSPSFPFPSKVGPGASTLTLFAGKKSPADDAIERAIVALGERVWAVESHTQSVPDDTTPMQSRQPSELLTPEWTPPVDLVPSNIPDAAPMCPSCSRPIAKTPTPPAASHPITMSFSTPQLPVSHRLLPNPTHNILTTTSGASVLTGGPGSNGWARSGVSDSGMSAEKELELLKAQVQDIARVCKAVATGDLTQKIIVPVEGQAMTELKDIINSMVDRLKTFAVEVSLALEPPGQSLHLRWLLITPGRTCLARSRNSR